MVKGTRQRAKHRYRTAAFKDSFNSQSRSSTSTNTQFNEPCVSKLIDQSRREAARPIRSSIVETPPTTLPPHLLGELFVQEMVMKLRGIHDIGKEEIEKDCNVFYKKIGKERKRKKGAWNGEKSQKNFSFSHEFCLVPNSFTLNLGLATHISSLVDITIHNIAFNICAYKTHPYFTQIPTHLKQHILSAVTIYHPLSADLLSLFEGDTAYEELDLAYSSVSFETLREAFWKASSKKSMAKIKENIVDDWEALVDTGNDKTDLLSSISNLSLKPKPTKHILSSSSSGILERSEVESLEKTKYICTLLNLRRLNLAFMENISAIPISTLLVSTVPLLTHLSIAGCFNRFNGPNALGILSRGLINLVYWDISYMDWLDELVLLENVNWAQGMYYIHLVRPFTF
ncbi:hypothetical protein G9A89_004149 [Geosiphon pyriformis]|nr:hypothetical protein G9A89_004149 [Geosiphon pyriformis]